MNNTISRIKQVAENSQAAAARSQAKALEKAQRRHEAAKPLFKAFAEVQHAYVKIEVLKRIWPYDFQHRPDRASALVIGYLGDPRYPHGLSLHTPGGQASYEVELTWDDRIVYVSSKETGGSQPLSKKFSEPDSWLAGFYHTMAPLLEI
jgi:hypothetical protein